MAEIRDWQRNRAMWVRVLERQTGEGVETWNSRIAKQKALRDEKSLRQWLTAQGVNGYAQSLLVMETFGYPDFLVAGADELIDRQYADRPHLRPVYDAVIGAATAMGELTIQARKTYVSLVSPRRTFARIQAPTRERVDLGLRIDGQAPAGRLLPSIIHETMPVRIALSTVDDFDAEARRWLQTAYDRNS
jgi:hypothetical protein